jgi:hypothetical protein
MLAILGLVALAGAFSACGDDDGGSEEDIAAVEEVVKALVETDPTDPDQVDFFIAHVTDEVMETFFGTTKKDCAAAPEDCIGEPTTVARFEGTTVSGSDATTTVYDSEEGVFTTLLVSEGDTWLLNEIRFGPAELPEGVTAVDLELADYEFIFDESKIVDGNIGFPFENTGEEPHQVLLAKVNDQYNLESAIEFWNSDAGGGEDLPPGVESMAFLGFAPPGISGVGVSEEPLEPGGYTFLCMIPNAEGTPHMELGMAAEFTVPE